MASVEVDSDTSLATIVAVSGQSLSIGELNAALGGSAFRITALQIKN